ncbi:MAG TPA: hypothetical protein VK658_22370 [Chryseolinea sp.]|nr:hypothetical protein [Chryseolinea sp.]
MRVRLLLGLIWAIALIALSWTYTDAQRIETLHDDRSVSLRGLSVVTDKVVWVSGSRGTVGRSQDGGRNWDWLTVPGYESRDFRDIEAFDTNTAVITAIAHPAHILRTVDGGKSWKLVYENNSKGMFLDAMDFSDDRHGIVVGDAVKGRLFLARTSDGGITWHEISDKYTVADSTEGCFASSGTNIRLRSDGGYVFVTGGLKSRMISGSAAVALPFDNSKTSTGANSVAVEKSGLLMIAVGGDFAVDSLRDKTCFVSKDGGATWRAPKSSPYGYRSCVEFLSGDRAMACGLNGVDVSYDSGNTWTSVSRDSFHACRKAKKGTAVFLSGNNGRIGKLIE